MLAAPTTAPAAPMTIPPSASSKHEIKTCPRCGAVFECKVSNPVHCQCAGIALGEALLDHLAARWDDCLCARCLRELAAAESPPAPKR